MSRHRTTSAENMLAISRDAEAPPSRRAYIRAIIYCRKKNIAFFSRAATALPARFRVNTSRQGVNDVIGEEFPVAFLAIVVENCHSADATARFYGYIMARFSREIEIAICLLRRCLLARRAAGQQLLFMPSMGWAEEKYLIASSSHKQASPCFTPCRIIIFLTLRHFQSWQRKAAISYILSRHYRRARIARCFDGRLMMATLSRHVLPRPPRPVMASITAL